MSATCPRASAKPPPGSLGGVADCLDVVAVGVADEAAVVRRVVLGPEARLVQDLRALVDRRVEERPDGLPAGRGERDVRLPEAVAAGLAADPEVRPAAGPVADRLAEVHDPLHAQRRHHGAEIIRRDSHVAVTDDYEFMLRFRHQTRKFGDFVVGRTST